MGDFLTAPKVLFIYKRARYKRRPLFTLLAFAHAPQHTPSVWGYLGQLAIVLLLVYTSNFNSIVSKVFYKISQY